MIQHRCHPRAPQKLRALRHLRLVRIHYHDHRIVCKIIHRLIRCEEDIILVHRALRDLIIQGPDRFRHSVDNDMRLLLQAHSSPVNPHAGAEGIRVRDLVSHDHNLILCDNELAQSLRLHAGFHAGILRILLFLPAEIGDAVAVLDDSLIPAARKRQVNGHAGILIAEGICGRVQPQSDTQSSGTGISDIDLLYLFQKGELIFCDLPVALLLKDNEILVLLHLFDDAVHIADIFVDLPVDQRHKERLAHLLHAFHDLIIIVNVDQARDHPLIFILPDISIELRHILHGHCHKEFFVFRDLEKLLLLTEPLE